MDCRTTSAPCSRKSVTPPRIRIVLGEASSQLPAEFKADHPEVNWARPTQLRHRIVHGYWSMDMDVLITTAELDLPSFVEQLEAVLREIDG